MPELSIIDDEIQLVELLTIIGEMAGYEVSAYTEARKFLSAYHRDENSLFEYKESDVIFLDLTMPDVDGIEVITELGERQSKAALVLMSGFDTGVLLSAQELAQEYDLNVYESLTKPLDIDHVYHLLKKLKSSCKSQFISYR